MSNTESDIDDIIQARIEEVAGQIMDDHILEYHSDVEPPPPPPPPPTGNGYPSAPKSGWKFVDRDDFLTPYPMGAFGPNFDDVPAQYKGRLHVYGADWRDTSGVMYQPGRISVEDGIMRFNMQADSAGGHGATLQIGNNLSAMRCTWRFKAVGAPGWKTAHLLWPNIDANWPEYGEIDFPEGEIGGGPVAGYIHVQGGGRNGERQRIVPTNAWHKDWNVFCTEYVAGHHVTLELNGQQIYYMNGPEVPKGPMHWVIQNESSMAGIKAAPGATCLGELDWYTLETLV